MKFARYLEETQIPEWKKAYINYRALKKHIANIKDQHAREPANARIDLELPAVVFQPDIFSVIDISPEQDVLPLKNPRYMSECSSFSLTKVPSIFSQDSGAKESDMTRHRSNRLSLMNKVQNRLSMNMAQTFGHHAQKSSTVTVAELLRSLHGQHRHFFEILDFELKKIESFYLNREKEAKARFSVLKQQLAELEDSRRSRASHPDYKQHERTLPSPSPSISRVRSWLNNFPSRDRSGVQLGFLFMSVNDKGKADLATDEYIRSKKKLKRTVIEFYRTLEVLDNYRTLNTIGFNKALKKFEKVTSITARDAYVREKIEPSAFASPETVKGMIKETEELFTFGFTLGDRKKALATLCTDDTQKSHYFATYRTGLAVGLAVPALVSGLYHSFNEQTRNEMPGWGVLLFMYGVIFVPVLFALAVGINILAWNRARINYVFIFELEVRTKLDYQAYFEIPAILLATLCYAFWLSFARIGVSFVAPTTWPLVWLTFCAIFTMNPLPIYHRSSRWWMYRIFGRLLLPGTRRVKFSDFWMADQFCSLVYSLAHFNVIFCVYAGGFNASWQKCSGDNHLIIPAILSILPQLVRSIQCIKCWFSSRRVVHLINCGKYASGILMYAGYYIWLSHGRPRDASLFFYCLFATFYSIYACAWDFLIDWSVLRIHCKYPLLREELLAPYYFPLYYFSIVTNALIRFIWVFNVPVRGPSFLLRSFLVGFFEMLRRWQWNFYRLESEHLGNVDQYRATGEVPLLQSHEPASQHFEEDIVFHPSYHGRLRSSLDTITPPFQYA